MGNDLDSAPLIEDLLVSEKYGIRIKPILVVYKNFKKTVMNVKKP